MAKVLVAASDAAPLESTAAMVESLGHAAILVTDASLVLPTIRAQGPDLVLQDVDLAGLDVASLMAALRSELATADLPVVFFSSGPELPATAARYDAWGYLAHPFGKRELARLLETALGPSRLPMEPVAQVQRNVRSAFHDHWNLLAALGNYVQVLDRTPPPNTEAALAVRALDELMLKLESKTDRLRTFLLGIVDSLDMPERSAASDGGTAAPGRPAPSSPGKGAASRRPGRPPGPPRGGLP